MEQAHLAEQLRDMRVGMRFAAAGLAPLYDALLGPQGPQICEQNRTREGNTLIMAAIGTDDAQRLMLRLRVGGEDLRKPIPKICGSPGMSITHLVVAFRAAKCLEIVLANGADPNARWTQDRDQTPLHLLASAMSAGPDPSAPVPVRPGCSTEAAARQDEHMDSVCRIIAALRDAGADISAKDSAGHCPILAAIYTGHLDAAGLLIRSFAIAGPTTQHHKLRCYAYARALLEQDARVYSLQDDSDGSPEGMWLLHSALAAAWQPEPTPTRWDAFIATPVVAPHAPEQVTALLESAVAKGALYMAVWLVQSARAEAVRARVKPGCLPVPHLLLEQDRASLVRSLAAPLDSSGRPLSAQVARVDFAVTDARGRTVMRRAIEENHLEFLEALCCYVPEATLEQLLCERDEDGLTLIGSAVARNLLEALDLLLGIGVPRMRRDVNTLLDREAAVSWEHLPCFAAVVRGHNEALEMLLGGLLRPADLGPGLRPNCAATLQHMNFDTGGNMIVLSQPRAGCESITLLQAAASVGNLPALLALLRAKPGADPRQVMPGNRRFPTAASVVLNELRLDGRPLPPRPDAALFQAQAQPLLRHWEQRALRGRTRPDVFDAPDMSEALQGWLTAWASDDPGPRLECLLHMLWRGASLTREQLGDLLLLLDACAEGCVCEEAAAVHRFVYSRLKLCAQCGLLGRWRRCACKQAGAWYCGRACQQKHWHAGHKQQCPLARQPKRKPATAE